MTRSYSGPVKDLAATLENTMLHPEFLGQVWTYRSIAERLGCTVSKAKQAVDHVRKNSVRCTITWSYTGEMVVALTLREQIHTRVLARKQIITRLQGEQIEMRRIARIDSDPVAQRIAVEQSWLLADAEASLYRSIEGLRETPGVDRLQFHDASPAR